MGRGPGRITVVAWDPESPLRSWDRLHPDPWRVTFSPPPGFMSLSQTSWKVKGIYFDTGLFSSVFWTCSGLGKWKFLNCFIDHFFPWPSLFSPCRTSIFGCLLPGLPSSVIIFSIFLFLCLVLLCFLIFLIGVGGTQGRFMLFLIVLKIVM